MDKLIQIQKNLEDYLKDVDNATFVEFVDTFAYKNTTKSKRVSKLIEKFIEDNDLFEALTNEKYDEEHPHQLFLRSNLSQTGLLRDIRISLVSLSHNRFRNYLKRKK